MTRSAMHKFPDEEEYRDILVELPCDALGTDGPSIDDYTLRSNQWEKWYARRWRTVSSPFPVPSTPVARHLVAEDSSEGAASLRIILEDVRRSPFAYFRFVSVVSFLMFGLSVILYSFFHVLLFNPVVAVFGAIGSFLITLLVQASLAIEKGKLS